MLTSKVPSSRALAGRRRPVVRKFCTWTVPMLRRIHGRSLRLRLSTPTVVRRARGASTVLVGNVRSGRWLGKCYACSTPANVNLRAILPTVTSREKSRGGSLWNSFGGRIPARSGLLLSRSVKIAPCALASLRLCAQRDFLRSLQDVGRGDRLGYPCASRREFGSSYRAFV